MKYTLPRATKMLQQTLSISVSVSVNPSNSSFCSTFQQHSWQELAHGTVLLANFDHGSRGRSLTSSTVLQRYKSERLGCSLWFEDPCGRVEANWDQASCQFLKRYANISGSVMADCSFHTSSLNLNRLLVLQWCIRCSGSTRFSSAFSSSFLEF